MGHNCMRFIDCCASFVRGYRIYLLRAYVFGATILFGLVRLSAFDLRLFRV